MVTTTAGDLLAGTVDVAMQLIAQHEGYTNRVYTCPGGQKTIGYGFTDKNLIAKGSITRPEADKILRQKTLDCIRTVNKYCSSAQLNCYQTAALCSFVYNLGETKFRRSTLLKLIRAKADKNVIAREIKKWYFSNGISLEGLVKRREAEAAYWLK